MNDRQASRAAAVGVVISLALVLLAGAILVIGSQSRMFSPKTRYITNFRQVVGLRVGSPVYMSGVQVGSVESIELPTDPEREGIPVLLAVDRKYAGRVRQGTRASLTFLQVLSGDRLVNLTPGDPNSPALPEDSLIPPEQQAGLFEAGASAAENLSEMTAKLNEILAPIERGEGLLGQMIKDPEFGQEGLANVKDTFAEARNVLGKINRGEGLLGQLITDREYARSTLESVRSSAERLRVVMERISNNEGALGALLKEGGEGQQAITELKSSVAELRSVLEQIRNGKGLLSKLLYDEEFSRQISSDLKRSTSSMASILEKIDKGEGSLGALINNPEVYQGLSDVVAGIRGSKVGKGLMHHYQKKGAKQRQKGEQQPPPPQPAPTPIP
ncbi:MAG: hypothetical protein DMF49_03255 [Acidobacteria bacterium]|nr:MAG: hypothetical protein DMF49_03255 [Acidobacteriota bacterium]